MVRWARHAELIPTMPCGSSRRPPRVAPKCTLLSDRSAGLVREELRKFKQRLETGEISISDGPRACRGRHSRGAPKR